MIAFATRSPARWLCPKSRSGAPEPLYLFISSNAMTKPKTILAIDPGLNEMGYAVLHGQVLVDQNVISFTGLNRRVAAARSALRVLIQRHRPSDLVVEQTHRYPNGLHRL